jgi:hypothetical protein
MATQWMIDLCKISHVNQNISRSIKINPSCLQRLSSAQNQRKLLQAPLQAVSKFEV